MLKKWDKAVLVLVGAMTLLGLYLGFGSWSAIGLALDAAGFLLLWRFGLPSDLKAGGKVVNTQWDVTHDANEEKRYKLANILSHFAVALVVFGFALQFIGARFSS